MERALFELDEADQQAEVARDAVEQARAKAKRGGIDGADDELGLPPLVSTVPPKKRKVSKTPKTKGPLENHFAVNQRAAAVYEGIDAFPMETMLVEDLDNQ